MPDIRPFHPGDARSLELLAQQQWPKAPHPGGLGWQLALGDFSADNTALAHRGSALVGWCSVEAPNALSPRNQITLQGAEADPGAGAALLEWAMGRTEGTAVDLLVFTGDDTLRALASEAGFETAPENVFGEWMSRRAAEEEVSLPEGYRVRAVREGEEEARVQCHRSAWKPADLPWPDRPGGPVDPAVNSRFNRERYDSARAALLYDRELDLVVEAPDGSLAACCVVWWDPRNHCSEIEPLGVVPAHRRRGLASALALTACTLTARRGGDRVFINTTPNEAYPTPARTYLTVGYRTVDRGIVHTRPAP